MAGRIRPKTKINMSTQKQKFELFSRLQSLGFTYEESAQLRRIEMTLQRWGEQECGDGNNWASWAIERDEKTGIPYRVTYPHSGKSYRTRIADREAGALKRLKAIVDARNMRLAGKGAFVLPYHQSDPRGCALYLVPASELIASDGSSLPVDQYYNRGLAVCA